MQQDSTRLALGEDRVESPDPVRRRPPSARASETPAALPPPLHARALLLLGSSPRIRPPAVAPWERSAKSAARPASTGSSAPRRAASQRQRAALPPERRARPPHVSSLERRAQPPRAGPELELADMLASGHSLGARRRIRRPQPKPPRLALPRVPPPERRADSACAAAREEDRPLRCGQAGASLPCSALCARWIT
jgi:hypothetical protein